MGFLRVSLTIVIAETASTAASQDNNDNYDPKATVVSEHIVFPFPAQDFFPATQCGE